MDDGSAEAPLWRQFLAAAGPVVLITSCGMASGYSAVLLPQLENNGTIAIDAERSSWIASMAALPMAPGCILGGFLMERLGRKAAHLISAVPCLLGWAIIYSFDSFEGLLVGRFLTGLVTGLTGPVSGVYISETSAPEVRGFLLAAISLAIAVGLLFVHLLGTFVTWRLTALISVSLPCLTIGLLLPAPESPSWLAKQGKPEEAERAFVWCRGRSPEAVREMHAIFESRKTVDEPVSITKSAFLKPLAISVVFFVTAQFSGVNAVAFYCVAVMRDALGAGLDAHAAMLTVDVIRVAMSVVACVLLRRCGRRPLALVSGLGTAASLFALAASPRLPSWAAPAALAAYVVFVSVGLVPLPWAMAGEVFPLAARGRGTGAASFAAFAALFAVVKTSPALFERLGGGGAFAVYGAVALLGTAFLWAFLPETKGKTLQEIEERFK